MVESQPPTLPSCSPRTQLPVTRDPFVMTQSAELSAFWPSTVEVYSSACAVVNPSSFLSTPTNQACLSSSMKFLYAERRRPWSADKSRQLSVRQQCGKSLYNCKPRLTFFGIGEPWVSLG